MKTDAITAKSIENDIKLYIYSGIYAAIIAAMLVIGREMTHLLSPVDNTEISEEMRP